MPSPHQQQTIDQRELQHSTYVSNLVKQMYFLEIELYKCKNYIRHLKKKHKEKVSTFSFYRKPSRKSRSVRRRKPSRKSRSVRRRKPSRKSRS